jgi:predicted HicB family RNase H-like nuclease
MTDRQWTLRVPPELHQRVVDLATEDERSVNQMYIILIRRAIVEQDELKAAEERGRHA